MDVERADQGPVRHLVYNPLKATSCLQPRRAQRTKVLCDPGPVRHLVYNPLVYNPDNLVKQD